MTTVKQSVPLFLSSSRDVTGDTDETSFTVRLSPPLIISDQAKKVTAFIDSATVPYSFPNVTASTGTVVVRIPLGEGHGNSGDVTLSLPTGVYTLTEIAQQLNNAVNTWLHNNHYPVLTGSWEYYDFSTDAIATKTSVPNFCSFIPDFHKNRVVLTLNYDGSQIDFSPAATSTTLDDLLGFASKCHRTPQGQVVIGSGGYPLAASFRTLEYGASSLSWVNVYATVSQGTYTEESLALEINTQFVAALQARQTEVYDSPRAGAASATGPLIRDIALQASDEVSGEFRVDFSYASTVNDKAGSALFGHYDASFGSISTDEEIANIQSLIGNPDYFVSNGDHTRANAWTGGESTKKFVAENAATIDKVTEVWIAAPGLAHGSYSADGSSSGATLATRVRAPPRVLPVPVRYWYCIPVLARKRGFYMSTSVADVA